MTKLECNRCGATAEGKTFAEADSAIDHSRGLSIGRPCTGDPAQLVWDGKPAAEHRIVMLVDEPKTVTKIVTKTKSKK